MQHFWKVDSYRISRQQQRRIRQTLNGRVHDFFINISSHLFSQCDEIRIWFYHRILHYTMRYGRTHKIHRPFQWCSYIWLKILISLERNLFYIPSLSCSPKSKRPRYLMVCEAMYSIIGDFAPKKSRTFTKITANIHITQCIKNSVFIF